MEDVVDGVVDDEEENHSCLAVATDSRYINDDDADDDGKGKGDDADVDGRLRLPPRRRTFLPICLKTIL